MILQAIAAMQQAAAGIDRSKRRSELIKTLRFSILVGAEREKVQGCVGISIQQG
jgi:hypothetical protein